MQSEAGLNMLFWLIAGHAVADFWAQSDALAMLKNRHRNTSPFLPWAYAMSAHALMHGAAVAFVTHSIALGLAETVAHWLIDFGKCEDWYGIHVDQVAHIVCKLAWLAIATGMVNR
jgi:hypothetical protein